mmetsp:Transcript_35027/g.83954  ORF Transcript_35027/g.83954 Transcript_35027/m.83954 type:complete len:213 (-) Transcript_35027:724-1362(-)
MPSSASLGNMRWFRSRHLSSATASGKTSSAPMVSSHSLMRSYWVCTFFGTCAWLEASCQALLEPYSPFTKFLGAPGSGSRHSGFSFSSRQSCSREDPAAEKCAALSSTESPGFSFAPKISSRRYAQTIVGARQIWSGFSCSSTSGGTRMRSSSLQCSSVRAEPIGFCEENLVGFGRISTVSSSLNSAHRAPSCSTLPTPVMPRQTPLLFSSA